MELENEKSGITEIKNKSFEYETEELNSKNFETKNETEIKSIKETITNNQCDNLSENKINKKETDKNLDQIFPTGFFDEKEIVEQKKELKQEGKKENKQEKQDDGEKKKEKVVKKNFSELKKKSLKNPLEKIKNFKKEEVSNQTIDTKNEQEKATNIQISEKKSLLESFKMLINRKSDTEKKNLSKQTTPSQIKTKECKDKEQDEEKVKKIDKKKNSELFRLNIPYRNTDDIPTDLFNPKYATYPEFRHLNKYTRFIHETTRLFSVENVSEYVHIGKKSNLNDNIKAVINERWNNFASGRNNKNFQDLTSINISNLLFKDFESKSISEYTKNYKSLQIPRTRITFHANPIIKEKNKDENVSYSKKLKDFI